MDLKDSYKKFDNEKIIFLAQYEVEKLTPDAIDLLKKEVISRNLDQKLIEVIDEQIKGISLDEFFEYSKFLLQLPCPICGQRNCEIDITRKARVVSVILFTGYDKILICGCKSCLRKEIKKTMILSYYRMVGISMGTD